MACNVSLERQIESRICEKARDRAEGEVYLYEILAILVDRDLVSMEDVVLAVNDWSEG